MFRIIRGESLIRREKAFQARGQLFPWTIRSKRAGQGVQNDVDARRAVFPRLAEEPGMARLQMKQRGLDVFARAESVDSEVHAGAGKLALREASHFDRISHAARRAD